MSKGMFGEKGVQNFMKKTPVQLLSTGVDQSCFRLVLPPEARRTFHKYREEWTLYLFCYFKTVKDGSKKRFLLKI